MKKHILTGAESFEKVVEGDYFYVDKTLFVKELLENRGDTTLITRPRRFGKTMNMSMLRHFFDVTLDSKALFGGQDMYNPWSITGYLKEKEFGEYWVNTGSLSILRDVFYKGEDGKDLKQEAQKGLAQIGEKDYVHGLNREGYKKIFKYGIAFHKKSCGVAMGEG